MKKTLKILTILASISITPNIANATDVYTLDPNIPISIGMQIILDFPLFLENLPNQLVN